MQWFVTDKKSKSKKKIGSKIQVQYEVFRWCSTTPKMSKMMFSTATRIHDIQKVKAAKHLRKSRSKCCLEYTNWTFNLLLPVPSRIADSNWQTGWSIIHSKHKLLFIQTMRRTAAFGTSDMQISLKKISDFSFGMKFSFNFSIPSSFQCHKIELMFQKKSFKEKENIPLKTKAKS